jgi:flagellin
VKQQNLIQGGIIMQVLNNTPAFNVWKNYSENVSNLRQSMSRLSSGLKIQTAADDPAGLAISQRLRAQASNSAAAEQNIQNALSYSQTADSWLQKIHDILGRMGELAVSASDGTKSATDVNNLQSEFAQMQAELARVAGAGTYNTKPLFDTGATVTLQIGPDNGQTFTLAAMQVTVALGGAATDLVDAANAVDDVNLAGDAISSIRASLGAKSARLKIVLSGLTTYESNVRGAESQVRDVDMAKEATSFSKYQILTQVGTAMMAQANSLPQSVLKLIQ